MKYFYFIPASVWSWMGCLRAETFWENLKHLNNFFKPQQNFKFENYLLQKLLLALSGAQGITMSVRLSLNLSVHLSVWLAQVCLKHWIFNLSLSALLAYFIKQTEPKILCLVSWWISFNLGTDSMGPWVTAALFDKNHIHTNTRYICVQVRLSHYTMFVLVL